MSNIITVDQLKDRLHNEQNIVIVDVRFTLTDSDAGRKQYEEGHIPRAVYLDLNRDLSGEVGKHGGNHPLPDFDVLAVKLGNIGIDNETTIVVYDQDNDMFSARFWWLLQYMGHEDVHVLEGGYRKWIEKGNAVTREVPKLQEKEFELNHREGAIVTMEEVKENISNKKAILIDSRARDRYLGISEPLYRKAGHIPGAVNYFWKDVYTKEGAWKQKGDIEKHFASLSKDDEIIVSCGSGVSACPNIIALKTAGFKNVKLYPGSFSDWISYDTNEVELKGN